MDKELLRIILIGLGIFLVVGIYLWSHFKKPRYDPRLELSEQQPDQEEIAPSVSIKPLEDSEEDLDIEPFGSASLDQDDEIDMPPAPISNPEKEVKEDSTGQKTTAPSKVPDLIQMAVIAKQKEGFGGNELMQAFSALGLIYDDMKIYHRYRNGTDNIEFSVANMVEPGTFPKQNSLSFRTPGLALFFQPPMVTDPISSFEGMVNTCHELADRLHGEIWDAERQPLTDETIKTIRRSLS